MNVAVLQTGFRLLMFTTGTTHGTDSERERAFTAGAMSERWGDRDGDRESSDICMRVYTYIYISRAQRMELRAYLI